MQTIALIKYYFILLQMITSVGIVYFCTNNLRVMQQCNGRQSA